MEDLKLEKEIAENKPKKLKESKLEYLRASLGIIFISAIACFGIAGATYLFVEIFPLLYTLLAGLGATVGVAGFLEIFPTSAYIDRKKYIKELDLDAINKKIVEKSQKLEFEMSKQNNNNDLIMLTEKGNNLQEKIDKILLEIKKIETIKTEIINKYIKVHPELEEFLTNSKEEKNIETEKKHK